MADSFVGFRDVPRRLNTMANQEKARTSHNPPITTSVADTNVHSDVSSNKLTTSTTQTVDDVFNYNAALLSEGLLFLNFLDSVAEGYGERIMRHHKYFMLLCRADGSHSTNTLLKVFISYCLLMGL